MTQFKDKAEQRDFVSAGLFTYPVLMAGDILLYQTDIVPIGDDQRQHLELARDIAERFNARFGETFVVPQGVYPEVGARIMDLQEPTRKMSTTGGTEQGTVRLLDDPDVIRKKFKSAVTDSGSEVRRGDDKPGISNLVDILSVATGAHPARSRSSTRASATASSRPTSARPWWISSPPIRERYLALRAGRGRSCSACSRSVRRRPRCLGAHAARRCSTAWASSRSRRRRPRRGGAASESPAALGRRTSAGQGVSPTRRRSRGPRPT